MNKRERRQDLFQHFDCVAAIKERRVRRQRKLVVIPANEIKAKGMRGADPQPGRLVWNSGGKPFGKFARRPVRKCQDENRGWIRSVPEQRQNALDKRARLARPGTGLKLKRRSTMFRCTVLRRVIAAGLRRSCYSGSRDGRKKDPGHPFFPYHIFGHMHPFSNSPTPPPFP